MIDGLKPYPAMKDSGVPWLRQVPEHWGMAHLRYLIRCLDGQRVPLNAVQRGAMQGGYPYWGANRVIDRVNRWLFDEPLVLLGEDGAPFFECGRDVAYAVSGKIWVNNHTHVLRCGSNIAPGFLAHALNCVDYTDFIDGSTRDKLTQQAMGGITIQVPPLSEQAAIVRFIDHVDRRIRRYIRAKQKLIKLLEEQKEAIIHRAATRGLDPSAPLKPSGVEWLGDVPEHWEVPRNGRLFLQRNETGFADLPILEVSLRTGVRVRDFENSDRKQIIADRGKYKRALVGDIAYNMMRMWQGAVGVAPTNGLISPAYVVAKPLTGTESQYFVHLFRTAAYMTEVDKFSRGIVKDRNRLYWEDFKQMPSCCPPTHEQIEIVDAIDKKCGEIDASCRGMRREIELLREYRTCLIADVVTGKLDVREAAARLPEGAEEPEPLDEPEAERDQEGLADDETDEVPEEAEV